MNPAALLAGLMLQAVVAAFCSAAAAGATGHPAPGASSCSGCHAEGPSSARPTEMPSLDALSAAEIEAALVAYRSGERSGTIMPRIAKGFSEAESRKIAASLVRDRGAP